MLKVFEKYNKEKEIRDWLEKNDLKCADNVYTITDDGIINVKGYVDISSRNLLSIPYQFGEVSGYFWCSSNKLTSLQGSPSSVGYSFLCEDNELTSLQYAPSSVGSDFHCRRNKLTSLGDLVGIPKFIGGDFRCDILASAVFGVDLLANVILPNYEIFEDMDVIYGEDYRICYQPNAFRAFVRQEAPSYLSKINLKEIEEKFRKIGYTIA
jgi:hypothetical protein